MDLNVHPAFSPNFKLTMTGHDNTNAPLKRHSSMWSSMTTTSASPLPRLLMVAVNGLNSQAATATPRAAATTPCRLSNTSTCLHRQKVLAYKGSLQIVCAHPSGKVAMVVLELPRHATWSMRPMIRLKPAGLADCHPSCMGPAHMFLCLLHLKAGSLLKELTRRPGGPRRRTGASRPQGAARY